MRRQSSAITLGTAVSVAALLLTGCATDGGDGGNTGEPQELTTVNVGVLPYANVAPIYVGIEQGIFESHGLAIETRSFQNGAEEIQALVAGEIDLGFVGYFTVALAAGRGLPLEVLVNNDHEGETLDDAWASVTLVAGDSDIHSVKDLEGHTLAVNALKSQAEAQNTASLAAQGADISKVELLEVPFPEMGAALANGSVDAISVGEPFVSIAIANGARVIDAPFISISPDGGHFPNASWASTKEFAEADADLTERLVAALEESIDYAQEHPEATREVIPTFTSLTAEQVEEIRLPYFDKTVDKELLQVALDLAQDSGLLENPVTVDQLLAPSARKYR